jgi:hypothetical protein
VQQRDLRVKSDKMDRLQIDRTCNVEYCLVSLVGLRNPRSAAFMRQFPDKPDEAPVELIRVDYNITKRDFSKFLTVRREITEL